MKKYKSFKGLLADVEKRDSYWSEKAITDFSVELFQLMKQRGLSKKDFAEKIGKSQAYITKVFKGNANFTIETMVKLTMALDGDLSLHITPKEEENIRWFRAVGQNKPKLFAKWGFHAEADSIIIDAQAQAQASDYQSDLAEGIA